MVGWSGTYQCECCGDQIHNGQWHRCVLCGRWIGRWCRARKTQSAASAPSSSFSSPGFQGFPPGCRMLRKFRGHPDLFSLHCLIWTSDLRFRSRRADICRDCIAGKLCIIKHAGGNEQVLPINVLRNILVYVGYASSW